MKNYMLTFCLFCATMLFAQSEEAQVRETLNRYMQGSSYSYPKLIASAFYEGAPLFLSKKDQEIYLFTPKAYSELFEKRERGKFNGRYGKILDIDISNDIATAKAEIHIPKGNMRFIDLFLLKRLEGQWKIISKAATSVPE